MKKKKKKTHNSKKLFRCKAAIKNGRVQIYK